MNYLVEHKKPGEGWKEIYTGPRRGWAWKQYFTLKVKMKPEEKIRFMEENPSVKKGFKKVAGHTCFYTGPR